MTLTSKANLFPSLLSTANQLINDTDSISPQRKARLQELAAFISEKEAVKLNFICTHNSRRSHIAQIWAATAAAYYGLDLSTYSGGTEATALAPQVVMALLKAGFKVEHSGGDNPSYLFSYAPEKRPIVCFSKTYDDDYNPVRGFAAIMTCSDADEECPYIPGSDFRLALTYEDPKHADGTTEEAAAYEATVQQIGREIFYAMQLASTKIT